MNLLFLNILTSIPDLITKSVESNPDIAYIVIGMAMFLENIIPPIPSEIIMPLGGFYVYQGNLNFYVLVFFGLLGTVIGALPWYYLGKLLNEQKMSNFIEKRGKFIGITPNDLKKSRKWFDKYGVSLVFWGRLVPGIRTLISVPAGIELMPLAKFLIWTSLGSLIWIIALTVAGYVFGENYHVISLYMDNFKVILKPIFIVGIVYFSFKFLKNFRKN